MNVVKCQMSMVTSPFAVHMYDVLDHTNHIFSESSSSGDDNDWDEDLQKDKDTDKDRNKVLPRPNVCYIYQKQGVQEFECDIGCLLVTKTQFYALVELNIFQGWKFFRGEYLSGVNIFQG